MTIHLIVSSLDITKSPGPNGIPPAFFQKTSRNICEILQKQMSAPANSLAIATDAEILGLSFNILQLGPCALQLAVNPQQQQFLSVVPQISSFLKIIRLLYDYK